MDIIDIAAKKVIASVSPIDINHNSAVVAVNE